MTHPIQIEWTPVGRLFCSPTNPRRNDAAVPHVASSIRRFGWRQPIVARPSGEVIAGNTRLKAAHELGLTEVPVVWFDGPDLEATAYAIADNRTHEFAEWDEPALAALLDELRKEDALDGVGFDESEIDALLVDLDAGADPADIDDPGPGEVPTQPVSRPGDIWTLGNHRLMCGNSTSPADVARLMGDDRTALLSTDPPYCVDYTGAARPLDSGKDWSAIYREVEIDDFESFLRQVLTAVLPFARSDAAVYVWHAHLQYPVIDKVLAEFQILRHQQIIWVKPNSTLTFSFYPWSHEPCVFGWRKGNKPPQLLGHAVSTVWEADWEGNQRVVGNEHPTQKPLRLFEIPMEQHTRPGDIVLEPFSGSGSQLIAAERLRRRCRAMELSPAFVDVAVRRWQEATGLDAVLSGTERRTFAEIREERSDG